MQTTQSLIASIVGKWFQSHGWNADGPRLRPNLYCTTIWPDITEAPWTAQKYVNVPATVNWRVWVPPVCVAELPIPSSNVTVCGFTPVQFQVTVESLETVSDEGLKKLSPTLLEVCPPKVRC